MTTPKVRGCTNCDLYKGCQTCCVWGEGPKGALVMFIGEAPGEHEDANNRPFVGRAGKRLRYLIDELGIADDCYITNVVKCRPLKNRNPRTKEVQACAPYLREEIGDIKPEYIVLLGTIAVRWMTGDRYAKVGIFRGRKNWLYADSKVIATYHPAATFRPGGERLFNKLCEDLNRIGNREFILPEEVKWRLVKKPKVSKVCAFDLETSQLSPFTQQGKILCVSWSGKPNRGSITVSPLAFLESLNPRQTLIAHNLKFDLLWLRQKHGFEASEIRLEDTLIMAHLLDENRISNKLEHLSAQYTGYGDYSQEVRGPIKKGLVKSIDTAKLHEYCCYDSAATFRIWKEFGREIKAQGLTKLYRAKMRELGMLISMESEGIQVHRGRLKSLEQELLSRIGFLSTSIVQQIGTGLNIDSNPQLAKLLFEDLKLKAVKYTPTKRPSVDEEALLALQEQQPELIDSILERRRAKKMVKPFLSNIEDSLDENERSHPSFNLAGTVTGRLSCSSPNLQNVPREGTSPVKTVFRVRKGRALVVADYSQIELRIMAYVTRDREMLSLFRKGADVHAETARHIVGHDPSAEERELGKKINFAVLFGMGVRSLSRETGMSIKDSKRFLSSWYTTYAAVKPWQATQEKDLLGMGYVTSIFGRRRRLASEIEGTPQEYKAALRMACNFPIQGPAAELNLMAMVILQDKLPDESFIVGSVYDSVLVECPEKRVKRVASVMRKVMEDASGIVQDFGYKLKIDVPTPVDVKAGPSWGEMTNA